MEDYLKEQLVDFDTLILVKVHNSDDILNGRFIYQLGDFSHFDLPNFESFNDLIKSIYKSSSICEGLGYKKYVSSLKASIKSCMNDYRKVSFILPLRKNGKDGTTSHFLMNMNRVGNSLSILFVYYDEKSGLFSFEDFSSSTFKDNLTGLFNYNTLVTHVSDNKRRGYLCLFDLNAFKSINDNYGHIVGDDVLILLGDHLRKIANDSEIFYRRSGDEFVILVFENDLDYVLKLIKNIDKYMRSIPSKLDKDIECSASFGILELSEAKDDGSDFDYDTKSKLIDLAMYQAKNSKKLYHFISHNDALDIISKGDIDKRIKSLSKLLHRD